MSQTTRLAINGATGRMGSALLELIRRDRRLTLSRAVIDAASDQVGKPVREGLSADGVRFSAGWEGAEALDVVVDFSTPDGLSLALDHCLEHKLALVTGTTGLSAELSQRLDEAARHIALLRAANFSLGVAVLNRLLRQAASALSSWDLEIIEAHHGRKEDAPSGTALALGETAAAARGVSLDDCAVYAREGRTGPRERGSIGFAVVRGGDIVGEHTALLCGQGERIELGHRATDRSIFARGALEAAIWLAGQSAGSYDLDDMLASRS
ncbi:4-hydroxy-tetrahydrodipicolinate reductase [Oleiagrimonas sp. C23AA]|uniref:4-hydroxy-tetrahydrodipicolinate reductase n=1 Tax=Oleiagrimonas sp. C23AA TaxID=2719047 RepID=UPI00142428CD|nr:4-hydroxy-tetrahydrodipicolinate reductase [Oleiagrimonas sp. C23AA]NII10420.1 4-hydroxy-tetrahydrodipicolinate reductase [Oleiagrimonas sp. C23AA]